MSRAGDWANHPGVLLPPLLASVVLAAGGVHFTRMAAPTVDGRLEEWALEPLPLTQHYPDDGAPPRQPTRMAAGYDDTALYFAFEVTAPQVTARLSRRDRDVGSDSITVELDTRGGSVKSQMKRADRLGCAMVLILGEDELARGVVTLREMQSSQQSEIPLTEAVSQIRARLVGR